MATETIPRAQQTTPPGGLAPDGAETLLDVLRSRAETTPEQTHLLLYDDQDRLSTLSFAELLAGASAVAQGLAARGIRCPADWSNCLV